jgi:uncharacterized protein with gpF-like domain
MEVFDKLREFALMRQRNADLKASGMTVAFKPPTAAIDAYRAALAGQVALIEGIDRKHLKGVEDLVWRSVMKGYDMYSLSVGLQEKYGFTRDQAASIARHQANMAHVVIDNARKLELGITEAIWRHSGAGRSPRPSHVAFNGKRFNIITGAFLDGKWVWPGSEPDCRCTSKSVIPAFED